jgi:hypothetical protein
MRAARSLILVLVLSLGAASRLSPAESLAARQNVHSFLPMLFTYADPVTILPTHTSYVTDWGSVHVVGEVWNRTGEHLTSVQISAALYNHNGRYLASQSAFTYLDNLPSGYSTCFDVTFLNPPGSLDPDHYSYSLQNPTYSKDGQPLPALSPLGMRSGYEAGSGMYWITGKVRNDAGRPVECVRPVATLYNRSGKVIGCEVSSVEGYNLEQEEVKPFELYFDDRDYADGDSYWLQVCGFLQ